MVTARNRRRPDDMRQLRPQVCLLDHAGAGLGDVAASLAAAGYVPRITDGPTESRWLLDRVRPDAVVLLPRGAGPDATEVRLLRRLQRADDPVPVIVLVREPVGVRPLEVGGLPCVDFMVRTHPVAECPRRVAMALAMRHRLHDLHESNRRLAEQVAVDFKTGLLSEVQFRQVVQLEARRAIRRRAAIAMLLLDIDDFKAVNDTCDYAFGDRVLRAVGDAIRASVRATDFAARLGGDEFCVLLPDTGLVEAGRVAQRVARAIAGTTVTGDGYRRRVTSSIGVAACGQAGPGTPRVLQRAANEALHRAKRAGKNRLAGIDPAEAAAAG